MKKLLKNKKGFTLMEMLIVVAIIVILVAISIPTFSSQLDNAKKATDDANLRAARGAAVTMDLTDGLDKEEDYYYTAEGAVGTTQPTTGYGQSSANKDKVIKITYNTTNKEWTYAWVDIETTP